MRGGFGGRMHAVLWHFVDAACRLLLMESEELVEWSGALAGLIGLLNRFRDVGLRENSRLAKLLPRCKLRCERRGKRAA